MRKKGKIVKCAYCGKEIYRKKSRLKEHNYCNANCQLEYEYINGIRNPKTIMEKFHLIGRKLLKEGKHPLQQYENKLKANRELGKRNYGKSNIENKFGLMLNKFGINTIKQYRIKYGKDILNRDRYYFIDFAIISKKIAIECDEEYWHRDKERERKRQNKIESLGWKIIRFKTKDIKENLYGCILKILPVISES